MRIKISMQLLERSLNKKLMVLQEESWERIKDLEDHIKRVFNLGDVQLELYIDGFWIPGTEKMCIVKSTDEVIVKEVPALLSVKSSTLDNKASAWNNIERVTSISSEIVEKGDSINEEEELLSRKKQELISKLDPVINDEEMDVTDFGNTPQKKRKRKRKHKKISAIPLMTGITPDMSQNPPSASAEKTALVTLRPGHIRFDNEEVMDTAVSDPRAEKKLEDWHQNLLTLAQERKKVVFARQAATNGVNGLSHHETESTDASGLKSSPSVPDDQLEPVNNLDDNFVSTASIPMESPTISDLMYFKKLIMKNFTPTTSNYILAVVEEIGEDNLLTLKVCAGFTDESFSVEELQDSEGDFVIVKINWSSMFEPRLVTNQELLSEYL